MDESGLRGTDVISKEVVTKKLLKRPASTEISQGYVDRTQLNNAMKIAKGKLPFNTCENKGVISDFYLIILQT